MNIGIVYLCKALIQIISSNYDHFESFDTYDLLQALEVYVEKYQK